MHYQVTVPQKISQCPIDLHCLTPPKNLDLRQFDADGKSCQNLLPNGGEIHGDESHGIESVKTSPSNKQTLR